jgi:hypothetical protein
LDSSSCILDFVALGFSLDWGSLKNAAAVIALVLVVVNLVSGRRVVRSSAVLFP